MKIMSSSTSRTDLSLPDTSNANRLEQIVPYLFALMISSSNQNLSSKNFKNAQKIDGLYESLFDTAKMLARMGVDVKQQENDRELLAIWAIRSGNVKLLKFLVETGVDIQIKDAFLNVVQKHPEVLEVLVKDVIIKRNLGVNVRLYYNNTPLNYTAKAGSVEATRLLIEHGADVNVKNNRSITPLHEAARQGHLNIIKLLLNVDTNSIINCRDEDYRTALDLVACHSDANVARYLIEKGANVNDTNDYFRSPLMLAIDSKNTEVAKVLLEHGANVNIPHLMSKDLPLDRAVWAGDVEVTKLLLEKGANVNATDRFGNTILFWAIYNKQIEIAQVLVRHGARFTYLGNIEAPDGYMIDGQYLSSSQNACMDKVMDLVKAKSARFCE